MVRDAHCAPPRRRGGRVLAFPLAVLTALGLAAACVAAAGCSSRERANPLDPANTRTGGAPTGFQALADDRAVELVWNYSPGDPRVDLQLSRATGRGAAVVVAE